MLMGDVTDQSTMTDPLAIRRIHVEQDGQVVASGIGHHQLRFLSGERLPQSLQFRQQARGRGCHHGVKRRAGMRGDCRFGLRTDQPTEIAVGMDQAGITIDQHHGVAHALQHCLQDRALRCGFTIERFDLLLTLLQALRAIAYPFFQLHIAFLQCLLVSDQFGGHRIQPLFQQGELAWFRNGRMGRWKLGVAALQTLHLVEQAGNRAVGAQNQNPYQDAGAQQRGSQQQRGREQRFFPCRIALRGWCTDPQHPVRAGEVCPGAEHLLPGKGRPMFQGSLGMQAGLLDQGVCREIAGRCFIVKAGVPDGQATGIGDGSIAFRKRSASFQQGAEPAKIQCAQHETGKVALHIKIGDDDGDEQFFRAAAPLHYR